MTLIIAFVFLIPIHPEVTTVKQIESWLPIVMKFWKNNQKLNNYRHLFIGLLSQIAIYNREVDLSAYNDQVIFHLHSDLSTKYCGYPTKPFK